MEIGSGEWNTKKYRARYRSGKDLGEDISLTLRTSQIKSDGYRDFHNSKQNGFFLGLEHRGSNFTNQFRSMIGYENTQLAWDGIYLDDINDRNKRRAGYKAFTDDFLQQIYSVNTFGKLNDNLFFRNVSYFVSGKGYYESEKTDQDFYSYNLDVNNQYTDSEEQSITTDLLRRKWIVNNYFGIVPTLTWNNDQLRADFGTEIRFYSGDHFGEATNFTNPSLSSLNENRWYRYYQYLGQKNQ